MISLPRGRECRLIAPSARVDNPLHESGSTHRVGHALGHALSRRGSPRDRRPRCVESQETTRAKTDDISDDSSDLPSYGEPSEVRERVRSTLSCQDNGGAASRTTSNL